MHKPLHHRFSRWLRLAVSGAFIFHSVFWPCGTERSFAQNFDVMTVGFVPISNAPPASITDLLASANPVVEGQISLTWTAPQGNVGGVPINNQAVVAYILHYATFSVADLSGDTTFCWWNQTASNSILLQPPDYIPKAPGQGEANALSGLIPGQRYYFGAESISAGGVISPIDSESASPALQASAVATKFGTSSTAIPYRPAGLRASASGGQFTLQWDPVTTDTNRQPITIDHYVVYRYDAIGSSPTVTAIVAPNTLSYTDTVGGLTYYYIVQAVSPSAQASALSEYVDSSSALYHTTVALDDITTRVVIPDSLARELNAATNIYAHDLIITLARRQQDEVDVTLRSYQVGVLDTVTGQPLPFFAFSDSSMQVQLGLGAVLGSGRLNPDQVQAITQPFSTAQAAAQIVSVYWYNGASFIRVGSPILTFDQALSVNVRNIGIYQIRATRIPTTFQLTQNSPYPRVITPNDPSQNNRVFWFFDNPSGDSVTGTIYDIRGAKVRDLAVNSQSPTANSLVWDGRDNRGAVVYSGVYLYKISVDKETRTGTVVVAR